MLQIHPNARTTPVTRAEIAGSHERTGILAQRYGVSTETIRKWRKRRASDWPSSNIDTVGEFRRPVRRPTAELQSVTCAFWL